MKTPRFKHKYFLIASVAPTVLYGVLSLRDYVGAYGRGRVTFVHGWPMAYLTRTQPESTFGGRWNLVAGVVEFRLLSLLFNLIVCMGFALLLVVLWRLHCRGKKYWQFSLRELLLFMGVVGIASGTYAALRNRYTNEEAVLTQMQGDGWSLRIADEYLPWYLQPLRDLRIVDERDWYWFGLEWDPESTSAQAANLTRHLKSYAASHRTLSYVRSLVVVDPQLSDHGVQLLCKLAPNSTSVDLIACPQVTVRGLESIRANLPCLKELGIRRRTVTDELMTGIIQIHTLQELELSDECTFCTPGWTKYLAALPRLRRLGIPSECLNSSIDEEYVRRAKILVWNSTE